MILASISQNAAEKSFMRFLEGKTVLWFNELGNTTHSSPQPENLFITLTNVLKILGSPEVKKLVSLYLT